MMISEDIMPSFSSAVCLPFLRVPAVRLSQVQTGREEQGSRVAGRATLQTEGGGAGLQEATKGMLQT